MSEVRLIDANALEKFAIPCEIHNGALTELCVPLYQVRNAPTIDAYPFEQVQELVKLNQQFTQEIENLKRPQGAWIVGEYMDCHSDILPKYTCPFCGKVEYAKYDYCHCGADMRGSIK